MGQVECNRPRHGAILITGRNERKRCKYLELVSKPRQDSKNCGELSHLAYVASGTGHQFKARHCVVYMLPTALPPKRLVYWESTSIYSSVGTASGSSRIRITSYSS